MQNPNSSLYQGFLKGARFYEFDKAIAMLTQAGPIIAQAYPDLDYVYSSECKDGISYSIKAGLEMINKQDNFQVMFVVADQVNLNYQTLNKMLDTYNASNYSLATLSYQNRIIAFLLILNNQKCKPINSI